MHYRIYKNLQQFYEVTSITDKESKNNWIIKK
jgi:hypothetical protein